LRFQKEQRHHTSVKRHEEPGSEHENCRRDTITWVFPFVATVSMAGSPLHNEASGLDECLNADEGAQQYCTKRREAKSFTRVPANTYCDTLIVVLWLRISRQYLSRAIVRGRGIVFRYHYRSLAKSAGKDFLDGTAVPLE
jgi:hypothetical protein